MSSAMPGREVAACTASRVRNDDRAGIDQQDKSHERTF
jgi:hypothetical protein